MGIEVSSRRIKLKELSKPIECVITVDLSNSCILIFTKQITELEVLLLEKSFYIEYDKHFILIDKYENEKDLIQNKWDGRGIKIDRNHFLISEKNENYEFVNILFNNPTINIFV